jgi:putative DNA primase/helicase
VTTRPMTDLGNAERLVARYGANIRYCRGLDWLVWDGKRWAPDLTGAVERCAKKTARGILDEAKQARTEEQRDELLSFARRSESASRLQAMVSLARSEEGVAIATDHLDSDPWLFNVQNGTIDLRTGELSPHRREALITKIAGATYDPNAEAPLWHAFLGRVLGGNAELISFVQRFAGYSLTGDVREQVLVFAHGPGANGKSTMIGVLLAVLKDYGRTAAPDLLLAKSLPSHPTEQADLLGLRLVVCSEVEDGRRWSEVTVKQLTGGDRITARKMREDFFTFPPTHKLIVAANHKPTVKGTDHAIWRRMRLIPFDVVIPESEKDPQLLEKLRAELPGILRWAVDGCLAWQRDGLGCPPAVANATQRYRDEQDVIGRFLEDCCVIAPHATVRSSGLYAAFSRWAHQNGERDQTQTRFATAIAERGYAKEKDRVGHFFRGIGLLVTGVTGCDPDPRMNGSEPPFEGVHTGGAVTTRHSPSRPLEDDEDRAFAGEALR